jgi:hypothetical protein
MGGVKNGGILYLRLKTFLNPERVPDKPTNIVKKK